VYRTFTPGRSGIRRTRQPACLAACSGTRNLRRVLDHRDVADPATIKQIVCLVLALVFLIVLLQRLGFI
jgi:hypothetical protein